MAENEFLQYETTSEQKTENLDIRVTPAEKEMFAKEAQRLGISISAFVRLLLKNWSDQVTFKKS